MTGILWGGVSAKNERNDGYATVSNQTTLFHSGINLDPNHCPSDASHSILNYLQKLLKSLLQVPKLTTARLGTCRKALSFWYQELWLFLGGMEPTCGTGGTEGSALGRTLEAFDGRGS